MSDRESISEAGIQTPDHLPNFEGSICSADAASSPVFHAMDRENALQAMRDANPHIAEYPSIIEYMVDAVIGGISQEEIAQTAASMLKSLYMIEKSELNKMKVDPNFQRYVVHEQYKHFQLGQSDGTMRSIHLVRVCKDPEVLLAPEFLTHDECAEMVELSKTGSWSIGHTRKIVVRTKDEALLDIYAPFDYNTPDATLTPDIRRAKTAILPFDSLTSKISKRISTIFDIPYDNIECPNISLYTKDDYFKRHIDGSFRLATAKIFLNDCNEAGDFELEYCNLGFKVRPRKGLALFHYNITPQSIEEAMQEPAKAIPVLPLLKNIQPSTDPVPENAETENIPTTEKRDPASMMVADFYVSLVKQPKE